MNGFGSSSFPAREDQWKGSATLGLALPGSCDEPAQATAKWLLALWQVSRKPTWSIWRDRAVISLELVAKPHEVRYQCHFASPLLAQASAAILAAHFDGAPVQD